MAPIACSSHKEEFNQFLIFGLQDYLEKLEGVTEVKFSPRNGCDVSSIQQFEKMHGVSMPDDLRQFYLATNGLEFSWKFRIAGHSYPVGRMCINALSDLCLYTEKAEDRERAGEGGKFKYFSLDSTLTSGSALTLFTAGAIEEKIYFAHSEGSIRELAPNFQTYFRQMVVHLGLPEWQALRAGSSLSTWAKQLYNLFGSHLLRTACDGDNLDENGADLVANELDLNVLKNRKL